ncbi:hypothetical protein AMTRI_Chr04g187950 [Amborella trichopoda]
MAKQQPEIGLGREFFTPLSRFGVLVAQLESIVASAPQQPPDPLLCFDLLSDLVSFLDDEPKESVLVWQRKCEDALFSLLVLGARRPVRRLASLAMVRVISKGDEISIYSRASSIQGWLSEWKRSDPLAYAGAAQCLGELYGTFGRKITSGLTETANIAAKLMKFHEDFVRKEALHMLQNALEGSGGGGSFAAYSEAFRTIMRAGIGDKSFHVRIAAARCLKTFASIGGPGLGVTELENSASYCVKALEDPVSHVRDAFAEALGAVLALGMNPQAQVQPRGKGQPPTTRKVEGGIQKHLIGPFMRASGPHLKDLRIGLTLSWVFFLQMLRLKYIFPDSELQNFASRAMDMLHGNSSVDAHALACVIYIMRVGITEQMTEPTQRNFLVFMGKQLESPNTNDSMKMAALRTLSYLLETLGEVPMESKEVLDSALVAALSHSSLIVRAEAALTFRALAEVDPTCVGGLISYGVTTLRALRESAAIEKGDQLKIELDSLHGQASVLAALISILRKLSLGCPARLPKSVFEAARKMLTESSRNPVAAIAEKEAGWLLLASVITSITKEELKDQVFDILSLWTVPFGGNPASQLKQSEDLTSKVRVWSAAVEALTAFIRSFVSPTVGFIDSRILLQPVLMYLNGALSYISLIPSNYLQPLKLVMDLFIIRTLVAYKSLVDPMAYKCDHPQLIQICTSPYREPSKYEESSSLRMLLDKRDACLGPWVPGRDWFEDELRAFEGGADELMPCVWENELPSFPQPEALSKMLVNHMLVCFGTVFATQDADSKLRLLSTIEQPLRTGKRQSWHVALTTNVCVGLLAGLKASLALRTQALGMEILSAVQSILQGVLLEGDVTVAQRRAASEGLGLLARFGNDAFTARMTRSLLADLPGNSDLNYIGSIALALGCIHRSAGGMALSTLVPATVNSISLLAKSSNAFLQAWSLHGLLLTVEAAGLSYVSHVQPLLLLAMEILLTEENGWVDLRQGIGRLINAIVAVLGPELAPGSTFFSRCKSVVSEISSGQETSTLFESVRFTQQLVLFAPQALSVHSHVQTLRSTLPSKQPALRQLAVSTLRHLIEKDPVSIVDEGIEENLFSMLDEETDSEIGNLVCSTIIRLLYASCPMRPYRWIEICRNVVLTTSAKRTTAQTVNINSDSDSKMYYGEDDEDMITSSRNGHVPDSSKANLKNDMHLRYRTRVFAAECLNHLPLAVGADPAHFDLSLARARLLDDGGATTNYWLVLHIQELVALAYQISTSQLENMQPLGVTLLSTIMEKFESAPDPELPGHLLMEQYQAQLVSAVRTALDVSVGPVLLESGLQLATKILTSNITSGDRVAVQRLYSLISRPLDDFKDLYYPSFAEWVVCKIKIRLLAAHASVKCYTYNYLRTEPYKLPDEYALLLPLFSKRSSILGKYWMQILKDYSFILFGFQSESNYKPFLDGIESPLVSSMVRPCLNEAWPVVLQAVTLDCAPMQSERDGYPDSGAEHSFDKNADISGYNKFRLDSLEFNFLWGFALLTLFLGQQRREEKKVLRFINSSKFVSGDLLAEELNRFREKLFEVALIAVKSLSTNLFYDKQMLSLDLCTELLQVVLHLADVGESRIIILILSILSQIMCYCPGDYFESEEFSFATMELCVKYVHQCPQSSLSQDAPGHRELMSAACELVETALRRLRPEECRKVLLALLSASHSHLKDASCPSPISAVIAFIQKITALLRKYFEDESIRVGDANADMETLLKAWSSTIMHLSSQCIWGFHMNENKKSNSTKILLVKLSDCLEEAVSLAKLVHNIQLLQQTKVSEGLKCFSAYLCCIKCIQSTLNDSNMQVQIVGLHKLKSIAQRGLGGKEDHSFILFLVGELFGDIFSLIQNALQKPMTMESVAVISECLKLFVLMHNLSQARECQQDILSLLLQAIVMVSSTSSEGYSQELVEVNSIAEKLVSHLAHIPSSAAQFKDVLLAMPVTVRQQLQDIIRSSVTSDNTSSQARSDAAAPLPMLPIRLPIQPQNISNSDALQPSDPMSSMVADVEEEDGDDDDWDTFQSFPVATVDANGETAEHDNGSSNLESSDYGNNFLGSSHTQSLENLDESNEPSKSSNLEVSDHGEDTVKIEGEDVNKIGERVDINNTEGEDINKIGER